MLKPGFYIIGSCFMFDGRCEEVDYVGQDGLAPQVVMSMAAQCMRIIVDMFQNNNDSVDMFASIPEASYRFLISSDPFDTAGFYIFACFDSSIDYESVLKEVLYTRKGAAEAADD